MCGSGHVQNPSNNDKRANYSWQLILECKVSIQTLVLRISLIIKNYRTAIVKFDEELPDGSEQVLFGLWSERQTD